MSLSITTATTPEQREAVFRLRYTVLVEEARLLSALADHQCRCIEEPLDATARLLVARQGDAVVGALRINLLGEGDWGGEARILHTDRVPGAHAHTTALSSSPLVASGFQASDVSLSLVVEAFRMNLDEGVTHDFVACAPGQEAFYESLGYRAYGGRVRHPERGEVLPMVLALLDRAHLEAIGSPLSVRSREHRVDRPDRLTPH